MSVRGDSKAAKALAKALTQLGADVDRGALTKVLAAEARELLDDGFAKGISPDGKTWATLTSRDGQPLRDTRRLQASFTTDIQDKRFSIGTNFEYAAIHQFGGEIEPVTAKNLAFRIRGKLVLTKKVRIPARPMLPLGTMPARWSNALREAAEDFVSDRVPA